MRLKRRELITAAASGGLVLPGLARLAMAAPGVRMFASVEQLRPVYDHIIVGASSAGCVLAHRLDRGGRRVLAIEAGGPATLAAIAHPPDLPGACCTVRAGHTHDNRSAAGKITG